MDIEKMREQFEAWAITSAYLGLSDECMERWEDGYVGPELHAAWEAWPASREAVVVGLPPAPAKPEDPEFALGDSHMDAYNAAVRMRDACVKAIEAQGLKVAP